MKGNTSSQLDLFPVESTAVISPCGVYRYELTRQWGDGPLLAWVMLNPSTADHTEDDPTITRCRTRARSSRYGGIWVVNLFALRATDPAELIDHPDPVGPDNERAINRVIESECDVVLAWGNGGQTGYDRVTEKLASRERVFVLGSLTKCVQPRHPLYVGYEIPMVAIDPICIGGGGR